MLCADASSELHALEARISAGHRVAGETMTTKRVGAAHAQHSAATTFLLPTPALRANRRIRDFTQTNSLDMALSHNAASTVVRLFFNIDTWLLAGKNKTRFLKLQPDLSLQQTLLLEVPFLGIRLYSMPAGVSISRLHTIQHGCWGGHW